MVKGTDLDGIKEGTCQDVTVDQMSVVREREAGSVTPGEGCPTDTRSQVEEWSGKGQRQGGAHGGSPHHGVWLALDEEARGSPASRTLKQ